MTVVANQGDAVTLALDSSNGFAYTSAAPISEIEALDSSGMVVGAISVPPTGSTCATTICRGLTTSASASAAQTTELWGIYSTPFAVARTQVKKPAQPSPKIVTLTYGGRSALSRLDPKTLKPVGKRLKLPTSFAPRALSPDGTRLLGLAYPNKLSIVNLKTLSLESTVGRRLAADLGSANVRAVAWPVSNRLLIVAQTFRGPYNRNIGSRKLVAIDSRSGKVAWRRTLTNKLALRSSQLAGDRLVLLLTASGVRPKTQTVIVASPSGAIHSTTVRTPYPHNNANSSALVVTRGSNPAAYLVADKTIFSIDLDTAQLTPHRVEPPPGAPRTSPRPSRVLRRLV